MDEPPRAALAAFQARRMVMRRDPVSHGEGRDPRSDLDDVSRDLVPDDLSGLLCDVPVDQVRPADPRGASPHESLAPPDGGDRRLDDGDGAVGFDAHRLHVCWRRQGCLAAPSGGQQFDVVRGKLFVR